MQSVGAQWFLVQETHSAALVAWVQTASLLPVVLLSFVAGVLADAWDRRKLLIVMTGASVIAAAALFALDLGGLLQPWSLLLVTFVLGCLSALMSPAWQAVQPELVPRDEIPAAASLSSVTVNGARAVGPAVAGVIVGLTGSWAVFAINALSFIGVVVVLARWRRAPTPAPLGREPFLPAMAAGIRYVRAAPGVRRILLRAGLFAVPACALWALLPIVATDPLGLSASGYGLLLGVLGAGAVLGVVVMPFLRARLSSSWLLGGSAIVYALGCAAPALGSVLIVIPVFVLTGAAWIVTLTTLNAALQLSLAGWVRARGVAAYLVVFLGGQGVASFVWGALAGWIGAGEALVLAAVLLVPVGLSVLVLPLHPATGTLDRTVVALGSGEPALVFDPQPDDGPVTIAVTYAVRDGEEAAFVEAMERVERTRRRTGAFAWRIERSGDVETSYREEFRVRSWSEFVRGSAERWTGFDRATLQAALTHVEGDPHEEHWFVIER